MKKIFTLMTALLTLAATGRAQVGQEEEELDDTFVFTDLEGNVVSDGTVLTVSTIDDEGRMVVPLKVRNVAGDRVAVSMDENIDAMPTGKWQTCAFGNCIVLPASGYSAKNIVDEEYQQNIETEWYPELGSYATWDATLQIHVFNIESKMMFGQVLDQPGNEVIGYGPKVTIHFEYKDAQGTSGIRSAAGTSTAVPQAGYALDGRQLQGSRLQSRPRGLSIIRMSDGSVRKVCTR